MATAEIKQREAIVLSRIPQKEHDAMVRCIDADGFFSFYARGALKMGKSSNFVTQELCHGDFNLFVSSTGAMRLKEGRIRAMYEIQGGLEGMLVAHLLLEYCLKATAEEDGAALYPYLVEALEALSLSESDPFSVAIMFLASASKEAGYGLQVDHCVLCGNKTDIVTLDLIHGGFLCRDCAPFGTGQDCGVDELKIYRHAFKADRADMRRVHYPIRGAEDALRTLLRHIEEQTGVRLRSLEPILKQK